MTYVYGSDIAGLKKVKLTKNEWKCIAPNREKLSILMTRHFYINAHRLVIHERINLLGKAYAVLITPYLILKHGFDTYAREIGSVFHDKEKGAFRSDTVFINDNSPPIYKELVKKYCK